MIRVISSSHKSTTQKPNTCFHFKLPSLNASSSTESFSSKSNAASSLDSVTSESNQETKVFIINTDDNFTHTHLRELIDMKDTHVFFKLLTEYLKENEVELVSHK